jgi:hypothetical protein
MCKIWFKFKSSNLYKSFLDLNIKIKEVAVKVKKNNSKILVNNKYIPLHINLVKNTSVLNKIMFR